MDVNEQILSRLDLLNEAHAAKKAEFFAKGLPFYTCVDSAKNHWTKEFPDGQILLVKRDFDFKQDAPVDIDVPDANWLDRKWTLPGRPLGL